MLRHLKPHHEMTHRFLATSRARDFAVLHFCEHVNVHGLVYSQVLQPLRFISLRTPATVPPLVMRRLHHLQMLEFPQQSSSLTQQPSRRQTLAIDPLRRVTPPLRSDFLVDQGKHEPARKMN